MTFGEQNTEADAQSQLDYALERGINFIDTAEKEDIDAFAIQLFDELVDAIDKIHREITNPAQ